MYVVLPTLWGLGIIVYGKVNVKVILQALCMLNVNPEKANRIHHVVYNSYVLMYIAH